MKEGKLLKILQQQKELDFEWIDFELIIYFHNTVSFHNTIYFHNTENAKKQINCQSKYAVMCTTSVT